MRVRDVARPNPPRTHRAGSLELVAARGATSQRCAPSRDALRAVATRCIGLCPRCNALCLRCNALHRAVRALQRTGPRAAPTSCAEGTRRPTRRTRPRRACPTARTCLRAAIIASCVLRVSAAALSCASVLQRCLARCTLAHRISTAWTAVRMLCESSTGCCLLHVACCMLHAACCMLHAACCMLHVACCMLHVVCCMLHVACCMLHVVCCMLCVGLPVESGRLRRVGSLGQHCSSGLL